VFKPVAEGAQYYKPEVVQVKLSYLGELLGDNHYLIQYYKGVLASHEGDYAGAKTFLEDSINIAHRSQHKFAAAYNELGNARLQNRDDLATVIAAFEEGLKADVDFALTHYNLGAAYLRAGRFDDARREAEKSIGLAKRGNTALVLGHAIMYGGKGSTESLKESLEKYRYALTLISDPETKEKNYDASSVYNFMPLSPADNQTVKNYVYLNYENQHRAFIHYAMSFNYAFLKNFEKADEEFKLAFELEHGPKYCSCMGYHIASLRGFLSIDEESANWFDDRARLLYDCYAERGKGLRTK
jgi:tetratricopeptide (TPR) repeat protein